MKQHIQLLVMASLCLVVTATSAQHRVENRFVGLTVELSGDWTNTSATFFGPDEAPVYNVLNRDSGQNVMLHSEACDDRRAKTWGSRAQVKQTHEAYDFAESDRINLVPFHGVRIYRLERDTETGHYYVGYLAYFAEDDRCFQVEVSSPEPFESEQPFFAATFGSLAIVKKR